MHIMIACENSRFSSLFAAGDVSRNALSGEERGEMTVSQANIMMTDLLCFCVVMDLLGRLMAIYCTVFIYMFAMRLKFMRQSVPKASISPQHPENLGGTTEVGSEFRGPGGTSPRRFRGGSVYFKIHLRVLFRRKSDFFPVYERIRSIRYQKGKPNIIKRSAGQVGFADLTLQAQRVISIKFLLVISLLCGHENYGHDHTR